MKVVLEKDDINVILNNLHKLKTYFSDIIECYDERELEARTNIASVRRIESVFDIRKDVITQLLRDIEENK